jgi:hypothetical protein
MERETGLAPRVRAWDVAVTVWCVACLGLALYTGVEVSRLTDVGDTLVVSSRALDSTATAIRRLEDVPFVGSDLGRLAGQIEATADSARASGASSRETIDRVAVLLAVAIVVIADVPPVVAYLTVRRRLRSRTGAAP